MIKCNKINSFTYSTEFFGTKTSVFTTNPHQLAVLLMFYFVETSQVSNSQGQLDVLQVSVRIKHNSMVKNS